MWSSEALAGPRRRLLRAAGAALVIATAAGGLVGCGWQLRRPPTFAFHTLAFSGFQPGSPMAAALRRAMSESRGVTVVDSLAQADLVLEVIEDARDRGVVAVTAAGQVREMVLRAHFVFRVRHPDGRVAMEATRLEQRRELSTTEAAALSKEREEAELVRAMQADIADQVLRRLASIERR
jgi:LPS-assembly lipoprotein